MTRSFGDDALLWETGQLSLGELTSRHPGEDVAGLVTLFGQLEIAADAPSDPEAGWAVLRERLPERISDWKPVARTAFGDLRGRLRRSLVAAAAATAALVGGTSIAYAAGVQPVRHEVDRIVSTISNLVPGHGDDHETDAGVPGVVPDHDQDGVEPAEPRPIHPRGHHPTPGKKDKKDSGHSKKGSHEGNGPQEDDQGGPSEGDQGDNQDQSKGSGNGSHEGGQGDQGGGQGSHNGSGGDQGSQGEDGQGGQ